MNNQVENLVTALKRETNTQITENGALAYRTTNSALLDFFGVAGALRSRDTQEITRKFERAFIEDNLLATKMMFYTRDIREGLGEKRTFRAILSYLVKNYPEIVKKNLQLIPFYGRWDDLYILFKTSLEKDAIAFIKQTLVEDLEKMDKGESISLAAKWLKSTSGVSAKSAKLGRLTAKGLGLSYKDYRKILSTLRGYIDVVERKMSANEWDKIDYERVPSIAMKNYKEAFERHNPTHFDNYVEKVKKGEAKINAKTLYPYDIMEAAGLECGWRGDMCSLSHWDEVLEQQWKALPNYVEGDNNILIMADTSGSMSGRPLASALGLAVYFAERNQGIWHNKFLTFSESPELAEIEGNTLKEKISGVKSIVANTNIEAAFDLVLNSAIKYNLTQDQLPKAIIIISDMEFDNATGSGYWGRRNETAIDKQNRLMDELARRYTEAGYIIPKIVYWNVDSRQDTYHATSEYKNVAMVSGHSVSTFKTVLSAIDEDPYQTMLTVLENERYAQVQI